MRLEKRTNKNAKNQKIATYSKPNNNKITILFQEIERWSNERSRREWEEKGEKGKNHHINMKHCHKIMGFSDGAYIFNGIEKWDGSIENLKPARKSKREREKTRRKINRKSKGEGEESSWEWKGKQDRERERERGSMRGIGTDNERGRKWTVQMKSIFFVCLREPPLLVDLINCN